MEITTTIQKTLYKISDFISWKKRGNLILSPEFQRRPVWKSGAKSFLIDTIYRGLPIPIIFLRDRGTDPITFEPKREIIDGQQRIRTVLSYITPFYLEDFKKDRDYFEISKSHNKDIFGKNFQELDDDIKQKILNYEFNVHILPSNVDDREVIQIFRRMNSTTYELNKQELRNAQYYGEFKTSSYNLASEQLPRWRNNWKTFSEDDIARMHEVELTSEIIISILEKKILGKSGSKIDQYYKNYDEVFQYRLEIEHRFHSVMDFIELNFIETKNNFVFYKKTLFYTFIIFIYNILFNLNSNLDKHQIPLKISNEIIGKIKLVNDRLYGKSAPIDVLEATDRRTTNIKEREILYNYLNTGIK